MSTSENKPRQFVILVFSLKSIPTIPPANKKSPKIVIKRNAYSKE